ncbi:uncharacterized protein METZ01_LOCUS410986, partial [marine metagenome]
AAIGHKARAAVLNAEVRVLLISVLIDPAFGVEGRYQRDPGAIPVDIRLVHRHDPHITLPRFGTVMEPESGAFGNQVSRFKFS